MTAPEFKPWPKTPRYFRNITITEKIDGTNAAIGIKAFPFGFHVGGIEDDGTDHNRPTNAQYLMGDDFDETGLPDTEYLVYAQSRKRVITPTQDNYGFAAWVWDNAHTLIADLGPGLHYGEYWGQGIQRNYGLDHKRFSLFNTGKWADKVFTTPNLYSVPVLDEFQHDTGAVSTALTTLKLAGSKASPGFVNPEGVVIFHHASRQVFKATLDGDGHKSR